MSDDVLVQLAATISARRSAAPDSSYTRQLLDAGPERCAKKFGEEAIETVIAGAGESDEALKAEAADLSIICWCCSKPRRRHSPMCSPCSTSVRACRA